MNQLAEELNEVDSVGNDQLAISSDGLFGPTFQGEGPSTGRYCYFLRLAGCNQHCVWCDTPYTWDWTGRNGVKYDPREQVHKFSVEALLDELHTKTTQTGFVTGRTEKPSMLVVSGGEPMLQQRRLVPLLAELQQRGWRIEVETAGTIFPLREFSVLVNQFNVSPKLENSGNPLTLRYKGRVLDSLQAIGNAAWKFVVSSRSDLDEIRHLVHEHKLSPVYIMPEGKEITDVQAHMREIAQAVLGEGWNLTTRLQVEIWGSRRGV